MEIDVNKNIYILEWSGINNQYDNSIINKDYNINKSEALKSNCRAKGQNLTIRKLDAKLLTLFCLRTYLHFQDLIIEMLRFNIVPYCPRNHYSNNKLYRILLTMYLIHKCKINRC